jgi:hypothetical protein
MFHGHAEKIHTGVVTKKTNLDPQSELSLAGTKYLLGLIRNPHANYMARAGRKVLYAPIRFGEQSLLARINLC